MAIAGVSQYLQTLRAIAPISSISSKAPGTEDEALRQVTSEFESMFIAEILKAAGRTDLATGLFGKDSAMQMYREMRDEAFAAGMASAGGVGIGRMLYQEMRRAI